MFFKFQGNCIIDNTMDIGSGDRVNTINLQKPFCFKKSFQYHNKN